MLISIFVSDTGQIVLELLTVPHFFVGKVLMAILGEAELSLNGVIGEMDLAGEIV